MSGELTAACREALARINAILAKRTREAEEREQRLRSANAAVGERLTGLLGLLLAVSMGQMRVCPGLLADLGRQFQAGAEEIKDLMALLESQP